VPQRKNFTKFRIKAIKFPINFGAGLEGPESKIIIILALSLFEIAVKNKIFVYELLSKVLLLKVIICLVTACLKCFFNITDVW
jgi:hypothetical protein